MTLSSSGPRRTRINPARSSVLVSLFVVIILAACQPQVSADSPFLAPTSIVQPTFTLPALTISPSPSTSPSPTLLSSPSPALPTLTIPSLPEYIAQSGDSLATVALRFNVRPGEIQSAEPLPEEGLLIPGQVLELPRRVASFDPAPRLLPDSEVVYSPSAVEFDVATYLNQTNGFLKTHREYLKSTGWTSAADILTRIAVENSVNPRLLLSLLEYHCHCVLGQPDETVQIDYLLGNTDFRRQGLYRQLGWVSSRLSVGYYGWRSSALIEFPLLGDIMLRPAPDLNAGSVALQYFFTFYEDEQLWEQATDPQKGLAALHAKMFGDPWERAESVEPLFPPGLTQPDFILPFEPGRLWAYTSGPHTVWENEGAQAALDFAPATHQSGCISSDAWAVAAGNGLVVRSEFAAVVLDLDGVDGAISDGSEQTGWAILYMHIESRERVPVGAYLKTGDPIGHPSCEGGRTTGTHMHIARKYNGEWVVADGPLPFTLEGWIAHAGSKPYEGTLTQNGQTVVAHPYGNFETKISRPTPTFSATPEITGTLESHVP